jgi:hypothetical protein
MCIQREHMPQVDYKDMADLRRFLLEHYQIDSRELDVCPIELNSKQCPDTFGPVRGREKLVKPLLVSKDKYILDGNHRWATFVEDGAPSCRCILVEADFDTAVQAMLHFGRTYRYGDGNEHKMGVW